MQPFFQARNGFGSDRLERCRQVVFGRGACDRHLQSRSLYYSALCNAFLTAEQHHNSNLCNLSCRIPNHFWRCNTSTMHSVAMQRKLFRAVATQRLRNDADCWVSVLLLRDRVHAAPPATSTPPPMQVGFSMRKVTKGGVSIKLWDVGGQPRFRSMWERYCRNVQAIVYVVDASDHERMEESARLLHDLLQRPTLQGVPLLVLGNKNDLPHALATQELKDRMKLTVRFRMPVLLHGGLHICSMLLEHAGNPDEDRSPHPVVDPGSPSLLGQLACKDESVLAVQLAHQI